MHIFFVYVTLDILFSLQFRLLQLTNNSWSYNNEWETNEKVSKLLFHEFQLLKFSASKHKKKQNNLFRYFSLHYGTYLGKTNETETRNVYSNGPSEVVLIA